jgi:hypothetical protein
MAYAYQKASGDGRYPANARQIMYAARPEILRLAGIEKFSDSYFTQNILPDYVAQNPEECADWDVVYDQRGHLVEPHTRRVVPLGTVQVRQYLGERPTVGPAVSLDIVGTMFPTHGPQNRYRNVLFVEKEGFDPLIEAARIAERFDIAPMSTKGMSVTAARKLLDALVNLGVERVLVLHDFDVSGFSIFGTLGTSGRRYKFENEVNIFDIGLRLDDIETLDLQSEPVVIKEDSLAAREETLREHGAGEEDINFLLGYDGGRTKRVELNAMTSDVLVAFLERKFAGVQKVVPTGEVLRQHALRLVEQRLTKEALDAARDELAKKAAAYRLPGNLRNKVRKLLGEQPELPWDVAVALVLGLD